MKEGVTVGPDLNASRTPLDKKLYRQVILKNGLRAILISDTVAMKQREMYGSDSEDEDDSMEDDEDSNNAMDEDGDEKEPSLRRGNSRRSTGSALDEEDEQSEEGSEEDGLRMAAAALVVGAGSYHDPPHAQGLAHFLEHMLFMGTDKYPTENAYDAFLSQAGGTDNAWTELEHTLYHFDVPQEHLWKALDMFCQFFISPLLSENAVERELNAIESEFQLSKISDECRLQQLWCHTSKENTNTNGPKHPYSQFSWGNRQSLKETPEANGVDIMAELRKFYNQYYYAKNMSLVVIGAYTLDELQEHVVNYFSHVPGKPREKSPLTMQHIAGKDTSTVWNETHHSPIVDVFGMPFEYSSSCIYRIVPVKERHTLSISWQVMPQQSHWKSKPCDYISHLIGHEAEGSLLSALKTKSWVTGCYAGVGSGGHEDASTHALFSISFSLSEEGVAHWAEIISLLYSYIGMLGHYCSIGFPGWIYEELRAIHEVSHKFEDEKSPEEFVEHLAEAAAPWYNLPPDRLLDGNSLLFEFDANTIKNLVENYLIPGNSRVDLMSSVFGRAHDYEENHGNDALKLPKSDVFDSGGPLMTEPMFGTKFWCNEIPSVTLQEWSNAAVAQLPPDSSMLTLPPVNPFIPVDFELKALPADDAHHPLVNCSLKLCITVGKKKAWFPATVTKFNGIKNQVLLSYEDEDEKWHLVDSIPQDHDSLEPDYESTFDNKSIKFRIVAMPEVGEGAVLKYGDDSDFHVESGTHFPPIPPPIPESRLPQLVSNTQLLKLWHLQDRKFKRPIAELRLKLVCAGINRSPLEGACADLFVTLCSDATTEVSYLASVCEIGSSISATGFGFGLRFNGFDHKLLDLAEVLLKVILSFRSDDLPPEVKPGRFDACLEVLKRKYSNAGMKASKLCSDTRLRCIRPTIWSSSAKANALVGLTPSKFMEVISTLLKKVSVEGLYHGNVGRAEAEIARSLIVDALISAPGTTGLPKKKHPSQFVIKMPRSQTLPIISLPTKDLTDPNTAVEVYFQVGPDDVRKRTLIDLIAHVLDEPFYDQLRTKEQFGYDVSCGSRWTYGVMGMCFCVVTSCKSANQSAERIERFLEEFRKELEDMKNETFLEHVNGLAKNKLQMFNSLEEECGNLWSEITEGRYQWDSERQEVVILKSVTKQELIAAYDDWLLPQCNGKKNYRQGLVVKVIGSGDGPSSEDRPVFDAEHFGSEVDRQVTGFHKSAGQTTWGKIF